MIILVNLVLYLFDLLPQDPNPESGSSCLKIHPHPEAMGILQQHVLSSDQKCTSHRMTNRKRNLRPF